MINYIDQIYYRATSSLGSKNIFYMPYNGLFEWLLADIKPDDYFYNRENLIHIWSSNEYPENFYAFDYTELNHDINCDFILVNNRNMQAVTTTNLTRHYHVPLVIIDHELPMSTSGDLLRQLVNRSMPKSIIVYPHPIVYKEWQQYEELDGEGVYVPYGFGIRLETDRSKEILGYDLNPTSAEFNVVSELSGEITKGNFQILLEKLSTANCFVAKTRDCSPPLECMLAASFGCNVFLNDSRWNRAVFKDEKTAFFYKDHKHLKELLNKHKNNNDVGSAGRKMMIDEYPLATAQRKWGLEFDSISKRAYTI